jgi:hypothetical protein
MPVIGTGVVADALEVNLTDADFAAFEEAGGIVLGAPQRLRMQLIVDLYLAAAAIGQAAPRPADVHGFLRELVSPLRLLLPLLDLLSHPADHQVAQVVVSLLEKTRRAIQVDPGQVGENAEGRQVREDQVEDEDVDERPLREVIRETRHILWGLDILAQEVMRSVPIDRGGRRQTEVNWLIRNIGSVFEEAGGQTAAYWNEIKGRYEQTPFVQFIEALVARLPVEFRPSGNVAEITRRALRSRPTTR